MQPTKYSIRELEDLVEQFQAGTYPAKKWTHEAHLIVALWYLGKYSKPEATHYLRTSIIVYNNAQGGKHTIFNGYHETLTQFWIWVVYQFLEEGNHRKLKFAEQVAQFLAHPLARKDLPHSYYSKEYLMSMEARAYWKLPDLKSLGD